MAECAASPTALADRESAWQALATGDSLTVVKLAPDGTEAARYPGTVMTRCRPDGWIIVEAIWTFRQVDVEGLVFAPGDLLHEWFSPRHDFNAFAVHAFDGQLRGWYANVTHPPTLDVGIAPPILYWHDLYLDVVALQDGTVVVCDEDELANSGLMETNPPLHERIEGARDDILTRIALGKPPFIASAHPVL